MRKLLVAAVLVVATLASTAPADAAPTKKQVAQWVTMERVYGPLYGRYKGTYGLDWNKNGCSVPSSIYNVKGVGPVIRAYGSFFRASCDRHDFGYRNRRVHGYSRATVDSKFLANMRHQCYAKDWPGPDVIAEQPCLAAAKTFYYGVRIGGGSHW